MWSTCRPCRAAETGSGRPPRRRRAVLLVLVGAAPTELLRPPADDRVHDPRGDRRPRRHPLRDPPAGRRLDAHGARGDRPADPAARPAAAGRAHPAVHARGGARDARHAAADVLGAVRAVAGAGGGAVEPVG